MHTLAQLREELRRQDDVLATLRSVADENPDVVLQFGSNVHEQVAELLEPVAVRARPQFVGAIRV